MGAKPRPRRKHPETHREGQVTPSRPIECPVIPARDSRPARKRLKDARAALGHVAHTLENSAHGSCVAFTVEPGPWPMSYPSSGHAPPHGQAGKTSASPVGRPIAARRPSHRVANGCRSAPRDTHSTGGTGPSPASAAGTGRRSSRSPARPRQWHRTPCVPTETAVPRKSATALLCPSP